MRYIDLHCLIDSIEGSVVACGKLYCCGLGKAGQLGLGLSKGGASSALGAKPMIVCTPQCVKTFEEIGHSVFRVITMYTMYTMYYCVLLCITMYYYVY